jgi:hypothetical protein
LVTIPLLLQERGCFFPHDESLADRPKLPPLNGKRRTKSALIAEQLEQLKRVKSEEEMDDADLDDDVSLPDEDLDARVSKGEAREALLHKKRMDMRARRKADRDKKTGDGARRGAETAEVEGGEREARGKRKDGRKKRKAWSTVRTQKRTAVVNGARFREEAGEGGLCACHFRG